jgi:aminopeptidase YwaD
MKPSVRFLFIILLSSLSATAQTPFDFSDTAVLSRFKTDISILASDSLQGRNSGTEGERKASDYLIRQFTEAGLEPKGEHQTFLQPFPNYTRNFKKCSLTVDGKEYKRNIDFGVMDFSAAGSASGLLVDAGHGICLPDKKIDDYTNLDVTGKIVLIDLDVPRRLLKDTTTAVSLSPKNRCLTAFGKGAAAVILHNPGSHWGWNYRHYERLDTVDKPVLYANIETVKEIKKLSHPIADLESRMTCKVDTFHNVVGYIDNHAPWTVILGAHYDHVGIGTKTGLVRNGADDNASGTALITELARYYMSHPSSKYNFLVIAYSGEEEWLKGSYWFSRHPTIPFDSVSFVFNFDMVGRLGCQGNRVDAVCTATSQEWNRILRNAPGREFRVRKVPGAGEFSDHYPFYLHNLPIAYLTTGLHYDYHTSRDDSWKINYTGMVEICNYSKGIISECEKTGKIPFKQVSGWTNARSMMYYIGEQLDYVLTVGMREAE